MPSTADLCDAHGDDVQVAEPLLRDFGGTIAFSGPITTLSVRNDNVLVRRALEQPGAGRVLVVDGGASHSCALLGDRLATLGATSGWAGVVIHGCVRDVTALAAVPIGIKAIGACPRRSGKLGAGRLDVTLSFAGILFVPGHYLYADADGLLVAPHPLT